MFVRNDGDSSGEGAAPAGPAHLRNPRCVERGSTVGGRVWGTVGRGGGSTPQPALRGEHSVHPHRPGTPKAPPAAAPAPRAPQRPDTARRPAAAGAAPHGQRKAVYSRDMGRGNSRGGGGGRCACAPGGGRSRKQCCAQRRGRQSAGAAPLHPPEGPGPARHSLAAWGVLCGCGWARGGSCAGAGGRVGGLVRVRVGAHPAQLRLARVKRRAQPRGLAARGAQTLVQRLRPCTPRTA